VDFISNKPVLSDHLSYLTLFHCSLGRSHKTGLTVLVKFIFPDNVQYSQGHTVINHHDGHKINPQWEFHRHFPTVIDLNSPTNGHKNK
jgi:hypothetical protein